MVVVGGGGGGGGGSGGGSDSIAFLTVGLLEIRRKAKSADRPSRLEQSGPRPSFQVRTVRTPTVLPG